MDGWRAQVDGSGCKPLQRSGIGDEHHDTSQGGSRTRGLTPKTMGFFPETQSSSGPRRLSRRLPRGGPSRGAVDLGGCL